MIVFGMTGFAFHSLRPASPFPRFRSLLAASELPLTGRCSFRFNSWGFSKKMVCDFL